MMKSFPAPEKQNKPHLSSLDFAEKVMRFAGAAVQDAIQEHHRAGDAVPVWRDGRVVLLHPDGAVTEPERVDGSH